MNAHTAQSLAQDLYAAGQMEVEAGHIAGLTRHIDGLIRNLLQGDAWKGPDAVEFGLRWERELERLGRIRAELLACAASLHDVTRRRHTDATLMRVNPYAPQGDVVA